MPNLSGLSTITTAANALANLVVVTPQSALGYVPQSGFLNNSLISYQSPLLFHYEGEQSVQFQSDITDHYIEDNTAIQDQVALKPIKIMTHGFIGELNDIAPYGLQTLQTIAEKLTVISAYTPVLSVTALLAYNEALLAYEIAQTAINAVSSWASIGGQNETVINGNQTGQFALNVGLAQNKQQTAFQQFYGYYIQRTFFTVQTPWAVFTNMMIEEVRAIQDAETSMISEFEVHFKQIRLASSTTLTNEQAEAILQPIREARAADEAAQLVNLGTSTVSQGVIAELGSFIPAL